MSTTDVSKDATLKRKTNIGQLWNSKIIFIAIRHNPSYLHLYIMDVDFKLVPVGSICYCRWVVHDILNAYNVPTYEWMMNGSSYQTISCKADLYTNLLFKPENLACPLCRVIDALELWIVSTQSVSHISNSIMLQSNHLVR